MLVVVVHTHTIWSSEQILEILLQCVLTIVVEQLLLLYPIAAVNVQKHPDIYYVRLCYDFKCMCVFVCVCMCIW